VTSPTDLLSEDVAEDEIELGQEVLHEVGRAVFAVGRRRPCDDGRWGSNARPRGAVQLTTLGEALSYRHHHLLQLLF